MSAQPSADRKLILYVEDEADNREITVLRLRDKYDILWARDDREACELIARNNDRIFAILMDIQLKGSQLDGIKLARILRGERLPDAPKHAKGLPMITAPIIFVTAYGTRYSEDELFAAGGSHVITKPVDFADLNLALTTAHARKNAPPAEAQGGQRRDPLAMRDSLTGLFSHRYFLTVLASEITRAEVAGRKVGLLLLDVDHLKIYNERCGRAQGDTLLRQIALLASSSGEPTLSRPRGFSAPEVACRYGGGELAILIPDADLDATRARAEALRKVIESHPFADRVRQPGHVVSVSVGVAAYPLCAVRAAELVEAAERALRQAKLAGRNRVELARPMRLE